LELLGTVEELSHLEMAATGEANSQLWVVSLKNRVFGQYIMLEASPESSDQNLWIQGILGTFRTFMVTPKKAHKSPNSWIGQIDLIWQEFESTTSPTFGIPKMLLYPSEIRAYLVYQDSGFFDSKSCGLKFSTTFMLITFSFDVIFKPLEVNLLKVFSKTDFRKLQILP
jgi:hypothetical protein